MSLAQHLTAQEGIDRNDHVSDSQAEPLECPRWRRMSFDVLGPPDQQSIFEQDPEPPRAAAYTISAAWRGFQVAFALVACCLGAGIVFGFASIKPVFIARGVYRELCHDDSSTERCPATSSLEALQQEECHHACPEQDMRLNLLFIVASIATNVSSLFAGTVLDRYGRRACVTASAAFLALGSGFMAAAEPVIGPNGYLVGNFFLSLGGSFLLLPSFQLSNAFPKYSGVIVAMVTCAFDSSSAIFLFYRLAWSASDGAFTPAKFFAGYLVVPLAIVIGEWTVMPSQPYHIIPELELKLDKALESADDFHTSDDEISDDELCRVRSDRADRRLVEVGQIERLAGDADERWERAQQQGKSLAARGVWGVLHGLSAREQMKTPWFILLLLFTALQMLRINYFIASIRSQYEYLLGSERDAALVNKFFDAALPIGGIASTPFIAVVLNNMSVALMLAILTSYVVLIGLLNCLPYMWAALATVVSFVVFRPFYYSAVSHTATTIFGFATFGRVYGTIIFVSGLLNISQYGLDALTIGPLQGNPTPVNVVIAVVSTAVGVVLTLFVLQKSKSYKPVACKADDERGSLVSGPRVNGYGTLQ